MALTASCVALATLAFSVGFGEALTTVLFVSAFVALLSFSCRALSFFAAASFARFAFLSFKYWTSGVVVTFSDASVESIPLAAGLAMGSVRLWRKSMNSWSWSIVPCLPS